MSRARIIVARARTDNYCYIIHREDSRDALVIDPSDSAPIRAAVDRVRLQLRLILNTHHHPDHVGGNLDLISLTGAQVYCSVIDRPRVPGANRGLADGERFTFDGMEFEVLAIPGHTQGQIAFHLPTENAVFVGDTLFAMGCGRLFEGTPEQMWASLNRLKLLPAATRFYFGHEYSERNAEFTKTIAHELAIDTEEIDERLDECAEALKRTGIVPAPTLEREQRVNPFLRAPDVEAFARLRALRDRF